MNENELQILDARELHAALEDAIYQRLRERRYKELMTTEWQGDVDEARARIEAEHDELAAEARRIACECENIEGSVQNRLERDSAAMQETFEQVVEWIIDDMAEEMLGEEQEEVAA